MIGQTISNYTILEKLGEGGMGVVYKAQDTKLDRVVALKFLPQHLTANEAEKARFLQEARAAAVLNHPNICTIYGVEEHDGQQFIEMEYVDGTTLRKQFENSPLPAGTAIPYAVQVAEALQEAHSKGIVHRDIKSDNIMVNSRNQIKVMDFGLAKLKGSLKLTKTSSTIGTLAYMSPEQIQGSDVDARSDIFSFGVVLFEMLTSRLPFRGEHDAALMYSILNEEPEQLTKFRRDAPAELQRIIERSLEKDPEDRYQSIADMGSELRRMQKQSARISRKSLVGMPTAERLLPLEQAATSVKSAERGPKKRMLIGLGLGLAILFAAVMLFRGLGSRHGATASLNPNMTFRVLNIPFTQVYYPGLSPDGNWVAFPAVDAGGRWDVYFMNSAGGEPRRVTTDSSVYLQQVDVSPDGSHLVYDRYNPRAQRVEICIVSSLGGFSKMITTSGFVPRWRPDGQRVGYMNGPAAPGGSQHLEFRSMRPDGSDNHLEFVDSLSVSGRVSFSWSQDGKSVAWLRSYPGRYQEIILHELETAKERQLTNDRKTIDEVCWTPDDEIIFSSTKGGNSNLWVIPVSGGTAVQLTKGSGPDIGMKISADGKKLVYLQQQSIGHLWVSNIDGSAAHQITFDDQIIGSPSFSPDGKRIGCAMGDPDPLQYGRHIYVMDKDGANRRQVTSGDEIASNPTWSPDGKWIAYASRLLSEPPDSTRIYVMEAAALGSSRYITTGRGLTWLTPNTYIVTTKQRSFYGSLGQSGLSPVYDDSTLAFPLSGDKYIVFSDLRKTREGMWISENPASSPGQVKQARPRMMLSATDLFGAQVAPDRKFMFYWKNAGEAWRISLPDGKRTRIQSIFPGLGPSSTVGIGFNGKEIVYVDARLSAKLVLIENLH